MDTAVVTPEVDADVVTDTDMGTDTEIEVTEVDTRVTLHVSSFKDIQYYYIYIIKTIIFFPFFGVIAQ